MISVGKADRMNRNGGMIFDTLDVQVRPLRLRLRPRLMNAECFLFPNWEIEDGNWNNTE